MNFSKITITILTCEYIRILPSLLPTTVALVFSIQLAKHGMSQTGLVMGGLATGHPQVNIPTTN